MHSANRLANYNFAKTFDNDVLFLNSLKEGILMEMSFFQDSVLQHKHKNAKSHIASSSHNNDDKNNMMLQMQGH